MKLINKTSFILIQKAIKEHISLERKDLDDLLWNKLPDWMDDKQKKNKVGNLISELRINGIIINNGTPKTPHWSLKAREGLREE
ncbi:hypothetical protein [Sphingobacterium deserti]|uniref:hypothetical protein n=1 Tax=Sphingobacterium deserti TaxID=1229276 RepID=UPI00055E7950|nr:hypothetical protein [Sphingobacterium deserti]